MTSERSVRVAGPVALTELVGAVREVLALPEGELDGTSWSAGVVSVGADATGGYNYVVTIDPERASGAQAARLLDVDREARQVFDGLAAATPWALCLLDHVGDPRVARPAVVEAAPLIARPLDAGPRSLVSERSVRVAGPAALTELVSAVRGVLGLPEGELGDDSWSAGVVSVGADVTAGYDYVVTLDPERAAPEAARLLDVDREARQVFDGLAAATPWALCLLDHVGDPRVARAAIVEVAAARSLSP